MDRVGVQSIPIVSLVLFCIGAILALQMAPTLDSFGLVSTVPDIIAVAVYRELGPLVSAVVLTGFAGASIAAEVGTMVVSEELEALEAQAISPIRFLVVPRVLATTVMMICIAVLGDLMGMMGGLIVSQTVLGVGYRQYLQHTFDMLQIKDFVTGLIMADAAIQVLDVTKRFGKQVVLDRIRLDVIEGQTLVILGGSGSGKSTLLRLMIGNIPYEEGDIVSMGKSIIKMT